MIELNEESFEREVLSSEGLVLVDFYSPKCDDCLDLKEELEEEFPTLFGHRLKLTGIDITKNRSLAARLKVLGLPACFLFKGGEEVTALIGKSITLEMIEEEVRKVIDDG